MRPLLAGLALVLASASLAASAEENDLRQFRVGMKVADLPASGYTDFACAEAPQKKLADWAGYTACPTGPLGLHAVSFAYDDSVNPRAQLDDKYAGTKVAGQPVVLALLIGGDATVDGIRIRTDPHASPRERKRAFLFGVQAKARYGNEGWHCTRVQPAAGEEPVGNVFIKEHCEKTTPTRHFVLDRELLRHPDQDLRHVTDGTQLTILSPDLHPG